MKVACSTCQYDDSLHCGLGRAKDCKTLPSEIPVDVRHNNVWNYALWQPKAASIEHLPNLKELIHGTI